MSFKINKKRVKSEPVIDDLTLNSEETINLKADSDEGFSFDTVDWATDIADKPPTVENHPLSESKGKKGVKAPSRQLEDTPQVEVNVDINNLGGKIEGSDYDNNMVLKKKKRRKTTSVISGAVSLIILSLVFAVGYKIISSNGVEIVEPEDNTTATINELVEPGETTTLTGLPDVIGEPDDGDSDSVGQPDTSEGDSPEDTPVLEGYLPYENSYVDFSLNYPDTWFITETTQEGFNQLKTLVKEGTIFSLNSAELLGKLPLLTLSSPSSESQETIIIEAHNKEFDIDAINAPLEFTKTEDAKLNIRLAQPTTVTTLETESGVYDVRYNIYKEVDIYTSVIQFSKAVGSNTVVILYTVPFEDVTALGRYEEDPHTGVILNAEDVKPQTLEVLMEKNNEVIRNILNTLSFN